MSDDRPNQSDVSLNDLTMHLNNVTKARDLLQDTWTALDALMHTPEGAVFSGSFVSVLTDLGMAFQYTQFSTEPLKQLRNKVKGA